MKKTITSILLFTILFLSSYITIAQPWTEDFNTQTSNSYGSTTITINGRDWTRSDAGNFSFANTNMGSYAFTINDDKSNAHITSPSLNTCGTISFKYAYKNGSSSNVFILQKSYDNSSWTNLETHTLGASAELTYVNYSYVVNDAASQIYIRILSDNQNAHLFIEDYSVTAYVVSSNDMDSDVDGPALASQPDPVLVSSLVDTEGEAVRVFDFDVWDYGTSDALNTLVTQVTIKAGTNNDVDWVNNIAGAKLSTDGGTNFITIGTPTIASDKITIPIASGDLEIADGTAETVSLFIYLKDSGLTDNGTLEFMVDATTHEFLADIANGSGFAATFPGAISNQMLIDVEASKLLFVDQPTDTEKDATMSNVTVEATDINGNRDLDFSTDISLSSTGTMTGDPLVVTASSGLATYNTIVHTVEQTGRELTAERDGTGDWDVTSDLFDITPPQAPVCHEEHFDGGVPDGWVNNGTISDGLSSHYGLAANCRALGTGDDITSPSFNYPEQIEFYQDASGSGGQPGSVEYQVGNNGTWTEFFTFSANTTGIIESVDLTAISTASGAALSSKQFVKFKFLSGDNTWYLDDVVIRGASCDFPIELNNFSATKVKNQTLVSWSTLTETNNDYFIVEWSKDGKNFEELGKVASKGTSREKIEYNYTHNNPKNGVNYYRLAQYDLDGRSEKFNVVSVYFAFDKENMIIVPNRIDNNLRIEFSQVVENGSLQIYNMEGKMVQSYILAKGVDISNFDVSYLQSGQYIAKYVDTFGTITKKFIKL